MTFVLVLIYSPFTMEMISYDNLQSCLDDTKIFMYTGAQFKPKVIAAFCTQGSVQKD